LTAPAREKDLQVEVSRVGKEASEEAKEASEVIEEPQGTPATPELT